VTKMMTCLLLVTGLTGIAGATPNMRHENKVPMYQAAHCHMCFTPAQAKRYSYACPISNGKMSKIMVSPETAHAQESKTDKALMGMKHKKTH
jgi:hypothetical protein